MTTVTLPSSIDNKIHPWRRCPMGKHLVREHLVHIPPSKLHPKGIVITTHEHCANNPSHKDELSFDEIQYITETHFNNLPGPPTKNALKEFSDADKYDPQIRGWVRYWNDIFKPNDLLDPNLIKALIATESSFDINSKNNIAYGLMQITDDTFPILSDLKGELKDYLIRVSHAQLFVPSVSICAGIRWLFRKRETASARLKRQATWTEAIEDYKSYLKTRLNGKEYNHEPMEKLNRYYKRLQEHDR